MNDARRLLTEAEIREGAPAGWVHLPGRLRAVLTTGDFATGLALTQRIGEAAEAADHHPDLLLTYPRLVVTTSSHDVGGLTRRDLDLARTIAAYAEEVGASADPAAVTLLELGLDTADHHELAPFHAALLGGEVGHEEVTDPAGVQPAIWFQGTDAHETPRQRWHPDVWVDRDHAQARIDAAIAAGGSLVDDAGAPSFWVLSDPQGNRVCICTTEGREAERPGYETPVS